MKKLTAMILMAAMVFAIMTGCGSRKLSGRGTPDVGKESASSSVEQAGAGDENSQESQPQMGNDPESNNMPAGFITDFDINKTYEPKPEIKGSSLADGAYVQIGNTVLKLGEATFRDFVNAGVDLYDMPDKYEPRNEAVNERGLKSWFQAEGHVIAGLIGNEVAVLLYPTPHDGLWTADTPVDEAAFVVADLYYNGGSVWYNGPNEYAANYINENKVKDYHSIYSTGGLRLSGSLADIPDGYGICRADYEPGDRGYQMIKQDFVDNKEHPGNLSILIFGNDKCCYMSLAHFPR